MAKRSDHSYKGNKREYDATRKYLRQEDNPDRQGLVRIGGATSNKAFKYLTELDSVGYENFSKKLSDREKTEVQVVAGNLIDRAMQLSKEKKFHDADSIGKGAAKLYAGLQEGYIQPSVKRKLDKIHDQARAYGKSTPQIDEFLEPFRPVKKDLSTKLTEAVAVIGILSGGLLFYPKTTGNVIGNLPVQTSNTLGIIALGIGFIALAFSLYENK